MNFKEVKEKLRKTESFVGKEFVDEVSDYISLKDRELKAYRMALKSAEAKLNYYRNH
jgi:hypothetical protein